MLWITAAYLIRVVCMFMHVPTSAFVIGSVSLLVAVGGFALCVRLDRLPCALRELLWIGAAQSAFVFVAAWIVSYTFDFIL